LTVALTTAFVAILLLLHLLEPEFNVGHMISEYQLGEHGWLMSLAFFCLGAASLSLFVALKSQVLVHCGRAGRWGLASVGVAYFGAGIFRPLPPPAITAYLHGLFGLIVILGSPIVFTSIGRGIGRVGKGSAAAGLSPWATTTTWVGLLLFVASIPISPLVGTTSPLALASVFNRLMMCAYCTWYIRVARHVLEKRPAVQRP
jgi:hypothetical protein